MEAEHLRYIKRVPLLTVAVLIVLLLPSLGEWSGVLRLALVVIAAMVSIGVAALVIIRYFFEPSTDTPFGRRLDLSLSLLSILGLGAIVCTLNLGEYIEGVVSVAKNEVQPTVKLSDVAADPKKDELSTLPRPPTDEKKVETVLEGAQKALEQRDLDNAEASFRDALSLSIGQERLASELLASIGLAETLLLKGNHADAYTTIENAKSRARKYIDDPPAGLVRLLALEGAARMNSEGPNTGLPLLREGLEIAEKHFPRNFALRGSVLQPLLDALVANKDLDNATKLVQKHIDRLKAIQGLPVNEMVMWLDIAGRLNGMAQKYDAAAYLFRNSLSYKRSAGSDDSIDVAVTRGNIALSLWNAANKEEARLELTQALKVIRTKLPPEHQSRISIEKMAADFGVKISDPMPPPTKTTLHEQPPKLP